MFDDIDTVWADKIYKMGMKSLGFFLIFFFLGLVGFIEYSYFYDICKIYYFVYQSVPLTAFMLFLGFYIGFNICYNFIMAAMTPAGGAKHLKSHMPKREMTQGAILRSKHRDQDQDSDEDEDLENNPFAFQGTKCIKCVNFKPLRAHHCSICDACVLRMDHHCPWINNCVGHYNQRFFLLMIFHTLLGTGLVFGTGIPLFFGEKFLQYQAIRSNVFTMVFWMCLAIFIIMVPFNSWNWFLAVTGQTTIEFWMQRPLNNEKGSKFASRVSDFRQTDKGKNLEYVFGTKSMIRMFLPSWRENIHDGINWDNYISRHMV